MFSSEFPKKKWNECVDVLNGKAYKEDYQKNGTYPICGSGGVMGYGEKKLCSSNTIILGRKGNINSPIYMDVDYWIVDTAFSLSVNQKVLLPKYFYFWCKQFDFTRFNKQGVLPSLTKKDLLSIEMEIPPIEIQKEFVDIYNQADKSKFGGFKSQFFGMIRGMSTQTFRIADIAKVTTGSTPSRKNLDYWKGGSHPWVSAQDMKEKFVCETEEKVTDLGFRTCKIVPAGSVLYVCRGSIGVIAINKMDCATNQSICRATCNTKCENEYLYYALKFSNDSIKQQGTGTSFKSLNQSTFASLKIKVPDITLQREFLNVVHQADKSKCTCLSTIKLLYLQMAFRNNVITK